MTAFILWLILLVISPFLGIIVAIGYIGLWVYAIFTAR